MGRLAGQSPSVPYISVVLQYKPVSVQSSDAGHLPDVVGTGNLEMYGIMKVTGAAEACPSYDTPAPSGEHL